MQLLAAAASMTTLEFFAAAEAGAMRTGTPLRMTDFSQILETKLQLQFISTVDYIYLKQDGTTRHFAIWYQRLLLNSK